LLQKRQKRPTAPVVYVPFDLLWDNGRNLTGKSVIQRRDRLHKIVTPVAGIQVGGYLEKHGVELFRLAKEKGLEGIIAKRKISIYQPGKRSPDWLKIKGRPQQEFVVGGFTEGKGSRKHFGASLLGAYRNGKLRYFGDSGRGFTEKGLKETVDRLKPIFTNESPFENPPKIPEKVQWVKSRLLNGQVTSNCDAMIRIQKRSCFRSMAARLDGEIELVAGAFSSDPEKGLNAREKNCSSTHTEYIATTKQWQKPKPNCQPGGASTLSRLLHQITSTFR
jgi:ATP dependent DNA ligase domain/ATP dependent DNA ligase C terminal region